jgi:ankyrin repeat protein
MKGQIPLHFSREIDHIKLLINSGSDVYAQDEIGYIPLYYHLHYQYVQ